MTLLSFWNKELSGVVAWKMIFAQLKKGGILQGKIQDAILACHLTEQNRRVVIAKVLVKCVHDLPDAMPKNWMWCLSTKYSSEMELNDRMALQERAVHRGQCRRGKLKAEQQRGRFSDGLDVRLGCRTD